VFFAIPAGVFPLRGTHFLTGEKSIRSGLSTLTVQQHNIHQARQVALLH
jgi:hypothetical protein